MLKKSLTTQQLSHLQVIIGAIMISICPIFVKLTTVGSIYAAFYRMLFGGICLFLIALLRRQTLWQGWKPVLWSALAGIFLSTDIIFWHLSIDIVGPGLATILGNFQVFILVFIGIFHYHEKVKWYFYLSLPLSLLGLYLLVGIDWQNIPPNYFKGVIYGLLTAVFYGFFIVTLRRSQSLENKLSPISNMAWLSIISCVFILLVAQLDHSPFILPDLHNFILMFAYGLFGQVLGWLLISVGLPQVQVSLAGFYILLQPSLAFIWDILNFKTSSIGEYSDRRYPDFCFNLFNVGQPEENMITLLAMKIQ